MLYAYYDISFKLNTIYQAYFNNSKMIIIIMENTYTELKHGKHFSECSKITFEVMF